MGLMWIKLILNNLRATHAGGQCCEISNQKRPWSSEFYGFFLIIFFIKGTFRRHF